MTSSQSTAQEQPGIIAGLLVFIVSAVASCIAWYPLGGPVYAMALAFRGFGCGNVAPGSTTMFFCSAGVALLQLLPAVIALVVIFVFRKPLMRWVQNITPKLPPGTREFVAPVVATCLFVIVWAGVHYTLPIQVGLLPQIIFPAVVGLFTFIVVRYGEGLQRALDPFFQSRDRFPRWLCFVGIIAIPLLLSVLITQPWRQIVTAGPQLEHFIVLVAIVVAFLLLTPRLGEPAPVTVRSGRRGGAPSRGGKGGMARLVVKGAGYMACRLALAVGMAAALHAVLDLCSTEVALAHDCTPDRPWDCQNTGGFNTTTATGSGVAGAGAAAGGGAVATRTGQAGPGGGGPAVEPRTEILSGRDAIQWMRRQGLIDQHGNYTNKFRVWRSALGGGMYDLDAIAGDIDGAKPNKDVVIVVRSEPVHQQEVWDSCCQASSRNAMQRLTGTDIPEAAWRIMSNGMPGGYRSPDPVTGAPTTGTSAGATRDLLNGHPDMNARIQNLTLQQMQQQLENGNELMITFQQPTGGNHMAVVSNVQAQPDGTALIQISDPDPHWGGEPRWVDERWWANYGRPNSTIVVEPAGSVAPPPI